MTGDLVRDAAEAAHAAAERAGVTIDEVHDLAGEHSVSDLFDRVWGSDGHPVMPANLLHAESHAGNYLAAARHGERVVGASFGFFGMSGEEIHLHSHMTGVDPDLQRGGVGYALKLHQRWWALERGLRRVQWTFDPLVRHNGYFNLVKLGAEIVGYHENFYGDMQDAINEGDESDRVVVSWDLASERVITACTEGLPDPDVGALQASGARVALDYDTNNRPLTTPVDAPILLCRIPEDVVTLRRDDPATAHDWRRALRSTLGTALQNGHKARGITRTGWYVLEQKNAA